MAGGSKWSLADVGTARSVLFVPGDRPERFPKAAASGAHLTVIDLEDAVPEERKVHAAEHVVRWLDEGNAVAVRINGPTSPWYESEVEALNQGPVVVVLPRAESAIQVDLLKQALHSESRIVPLVESATGVGSATTLARCDGVARLAFGNADFALDIGVDPTDSLALTHARSALVLASAQACLPGPIDGVTPDINDSERLSADVAIAKRLGFTGKFCLHPRQVAPVDAGFSPSAAELEWASRIIAAERAAPAGAATTTTLGEFVDKPIVERAQKLVNKAGAEGTRPPS